MRLGCCSVASSCLTLQDPKYCCTPDCPMLHCLSELLKFMSIESVMLSNHLILCFLLLLLSIFASTGVFSNEWALHDVLKFTELVYSKSGIISRKTDSRSQALNFFLILSPLVEMLGMLWPEWRQYDNWPFGCFWIILVLLISILICFVHWTQTLWWIFCWAL